jgi:YfiH family protein
MSRDWLVADWGAPAAVRTVVTTRNGSGASAGCFASFNLGTRCGDAADAVAANRAVLRETLGLPAEPVWLQQVHGTRVIAADQHTGSVEPQADAAIARRPGVVLAILSADCLPVLLASDDGAVIGAAHAGWRGLAAGVLEATVQRMALDPARISAWLGPAAGPRAYEVGDEVRDAFVACVSGAAAAFIATRPGHWVCDLYALARLRLAAVGVHRITGGHYCTISEPQRFFSHRRDGRSGRMASLIWREA